MIRKRQLIWLLLVFVCLTDIQLVGCDFDTNDPSAVFSKDHPARGILLRDGQNRRTLSYDSFEREILLLPGSYMTLVAKSCRRCSNQSEWSFQPAHKRGVSVPIYRKGQEASGRMRRRYSVTNVADVKEPDVEYSILRATQRVSTSTAGVYHFTVNFRIPMDTSSRRIARSYTVFVPADNTKVLHEVCQNNGSRPCLDMTFHIHPSPRVALKSTDLKTKLPCRIRNHNGSAFWVYSSGRNETYWMKRESQRLADRREENEESKNPPGLSIFDIDVYNPGTYTCFVLDDSSARIHVIGIKYQAVPLKNTVRLSKGVLTRLKQSLSSFKRTYKHMLIILIVLLASPCILNVCFLVCSFFYHYIMSLGSPTQTHNHGNQSTYEHHRTGNQFSEAVGESPNSQLPGDDMWTIDPDCNEAIEYQTIELGEEY